MLTEAESDKSNPFNLSSSSLWCELLSLTNAGILPMSFRPPPPDPGLPCGEFALADRTSPVGPGVTGRGGARAGEVGPSETALTNGFVGVENFVGIVGSGGNEG